MLAIGNGENCPFCELIVTKETDVVKHMTDNHPKEFEQALFNPPKEKTEKDVCYKCGANTHTPLSDGTGTGIIFTRAKIKGKWGTHPICKVCWNKENPNRVPTLMRDKPLETKI